MIRKCCLKWLKARIRLLVFVFAALVLVIGLARADVDFSPLSTPTGTTVWTQTDELFNQLAANINTALTTTGCLISTGANTFQPDEGSARAYYEDSVGATPTGYDQGRLWVNSSTGYEGQAYYNDGTGWKQLTSSRVWQKTSTGANVYIGGSGWQVWDAGLSITLDPDPDWGYIVSFTGTLKPSGGGTVLVRLYDNTRSVVIAENRLDASSEGCITMVAYYSPATSVATQITVTINCGVNVSRGGVGTTDDWLIVKEVPGAL